MPDLSTLVRQQVQQHMTAHKLSQVAFAQELGRSQSSISQLLGGRRRGKDLDLWEAIATYFGLALSQLVADAEARRAHLQARRVRLAPTVDGLQLSSRVAVGQNPAAPMALASTTTTPITPATTSGVPDVAVSDPPLPPQIKRDIEALFAAPYRQRAKRQRLFEILYAHLHAHRTGDVVTAGSFAKATPVSPPAVPDVAAAAAARPPVGQPPRAGRQPTRARHVHAGGRERRRSR